MPVRALAAALLLASLTFAGAAEAQLDWHPSPYRRMAVTDRSTAIGLQPRVWTVSLGGWVSSKRPEVNRNGWTLSFCCVESGLSGVSWSEGSTQRQRIFFAFDGILWVHIYDDDVHGGFRPLPVSGHRFSGTGVSAVQWIDGAVRRLAVASVSTDGRLCIWEGTAGGFRDAPWCSPADVASTSRPDVGGAVVADVPVFAYRLAREALGLAGRTASGGWIVRRGGLPPRESGIRPSVTVFASLAEVGKAEVVFAGASGRLHTFRFEPDSLTVTSWHELPPMPGLAVPASVATALGAVTTVGFGLAGSWQRINLFATGSDGSLYRIRSSFSGEWPRSPIVGTELRPPEEGWYGIGATVAVGSLISSEPVVYGVGGTYAVFAADYTLKEVRGDRFRDHIRYRHYAADVMLGQTPEGTRPATESTVSMTAVRGLATAIRRNADSPWQVVVTDSRDGGDTWSDDWVVEVADGWSGAGEASLTDPLTAVDHRGGFHHVTLEADVRFTRGNPKCDVFGHGARRLIYRQGWDARSLAGSHRVGSRLRIVATGALDHPGLAVTSDDEGRVTPHVVYLNLAPREVRHWWLDPLGRERTESLSPTLPAAQAGALIDAAGDLYAYSFISVRRPVLCRIGEAGTCGISGRVGSTAPGPHTPNIAFGGPDDRAHGCWEGRSCFDTEEPFGLAADATVPKQFYAVYQGWDPDGDASSVYFTKNDGNSLTVWSEEPVRVHGRSPRDATTQYLDPSITADHEGTLLVTYSVYSPGRAVSQEAAWSTDGGVSWSTVRLPTTWNPADLPVHCSRGKYFLGEYREGSVVGNRAYHQVHQSRRGTTVLRGFWASAWSIVP